MGTARSRSGSGFSVIKGGLRARLLVVCATNLTPEELDAAASLPASIAVEFATDDGPVPLATLCRRHDCTIADAIVIATQPQDLPLLLEARAALVLKGAGYENEAAADRVFPPRSAGGLVQAIRYVGALAARR